MIEPLAIERGLAVYAGGDGPPILLMPAGAPVRGRWAWRIWHYPFVEEPDRFREVAAGFLAGRQFDGGMDA